MLIKVTDIVLVLIVLIFVLQRSDLWSLYEPSPCIWASGSGSLLDLSLDLLGWADGWSPAHWNSH